MSFPARARHGWEHRRGQVVARGTRARLDRAGPRAKSCPLRHGGEDLRAAANCPTAWARRAAEPLIPRPGQSREETVTSRALPNESQRMTRRRTAALTRRDRCGCCPRHASARDLRHEARSTGVCNSGSANLDEASTSGCRRRLQGVELGSLNRARVQIKLELALVAGAMVSTYVTPWPRHNSLQLPGLGEGAGFGASGPLVCATPRWRWDSVP